METTIKLRFQESTHLEPPALYNVYTGMLARSGDNFDATPGITSCYSMFRSLWQAIKVLISSFKINDKEGFVEALIRVFNLPIGIAISLERLITFTMLLLSGVSIITLSLPMAITSFVFLGIEFSLELYRLIRTLIFSSKYEIKTVHNAIKKLEAQKTDLNKALISMEQTDLADKALKRIYNDYFNLTEKKQIVMINKLARTIRPFALIDLHSKILLDETRDGTRKKELIELLNTQINKALIVHIIGIASILFATACLVLTFLAFPPLIFVTIGLIGIAIEFPRYLAPSAFLDQSGYKWNFTACLPKCLSKCLQLQTSSGH